MATTDKPSSPEDEFFAKEDLEKLKRLRLERDASRAEQAKEQQRLTHWMKCPKCGSNLKETVYHDIAVDVCESCKGVYFDNGELELLLGSKDGLMKRLVRTFRETMQYGALDNDKK